MRRVAESDSNFGRSVHSTWAVKQFQCFLFSFADVKPLSVVFKNKYRRNKDLPFMSFSFVPRLPLLSFPFLPSLFLFVCVYIWSLWDFTNFIAYKSSVFRRLHPLPGDDIRSHWTHSCYDDRTKCFSYESFQCIRLSRGCVVFFFHCLFSLTEPNNFLRALIFCFHFLFLASSVHCYISHWVHAYTASGGITME